VLALAFFALPTQIHERYLFLALAFLTLRIASAPWILLPYLLLIATATLNILGTLSGLPDRLRLHVSLPAIAMAGGDQSAGAGRDDCASAAATWRTPSMTAHLRLGSTRSTKWRRRGGLHDPTLGIRDIFNEPIRFIHELSEPHILAHEGGLCSASQ